MNIETVLPSVTVMTFDSWEQFISFCSLNNLPTEQILHWRYEAKRLEQASLSRPGRVVPGSP